MLTTNTNIPIKAEPAQISNQIGKSTNIPWNKGLKGKTYKEAMLKPQICLKCGKEFKPRNAGQLYCYGKCYYTSENLKENSLNSKLIKLNKKAKWHKGFKHSKETLEKFRKMGKNNKRRGSVFEYARLHELEKIPGVLEVIRRAGSFNLDLLIIYKEDGIVKVAKEECKSSLAWFGKKSRNPLSLLKISDWIKINKSIDDGIPVYLSYREPTISKKGKPNYRKLIHKSIQLNKNKEVNKNGKRDLYKIKRT